MRFLVEAFKHATQLMEILVLFEKYNKHMHVMVT